MNFIQMSQAGAISANQPFRHWGIRLGAYYSMGRICLVGTMGKASVVRSLNWRHAEAYSASKLIQQMTQTHG